MVVRRMADAIRHRGPDDEGYVTIDSAARPTPWGGRDTDRSLNLPGLGESAPAVKAAIANRRLRIIDLTAAGHQPMASADRRFWIAFNGEIYNYIELRAALIREGCSFHTGCDTEVLLTGFDHWGPAVLTRLRGMFAFAVLDLRDRTLFAARDPFGIKPLYYSQTHGGFAFASEIKALLTVPGVSRRANTPAVFEFLRSGISDDGDRTMFEDAKQLPGGHSICVSLDAPESAVISRYWCLPERDGASRTGRDASEALRAALEQSVQLHVRSDAPVGSCLSGGLDSTLIVALAAPMMPANKVFRTVSFISPDPVTSELEFVKLAESRLAVRGSHVMLSPEDLRADLERLVRSQDVPFGSLSIYAQFGVFRRARELGLTVMLDGQGSDELFGGYNTAVSAAIAERMARGSLHRSLRLARAFSPLGARAYSRTLLSALGRFAPPSTTPALRRIIRDPLTPEWLDGRWFASRGSPAGVRPQGRGRNALDQELRLFTQQLSLPQLLRYEDRNSMEFSVESRVPYCDIGVADVAAHIPTDLLITDSGETKAPLRAAARGLVPEEIIDRPKVGFAAPDRAWLAVLRPSIMEMLRADAGRLPFLRAGEFQTVLERDLRGDRYFPPSLWRALNTVLWARAFDVDAA